MIEGKASEPVAPKRIEPESSSKKPAPKIEAAEERPEPEQTKKVEDPERKEITVA